MPISYDNANYTPPMRGYSGQGAFRFWCQTVLPIVYDDSLSYYELLNKVVVYLNNTISDVANVEDNVQDLHDAYVSMQGYVNDTYNELTSFVNNYFDNLDVQNEINEKLDAMAESGELTSLISPMIPDAVSAWLDENITPTTPAVDESLSISGAAADAKVTGDKFTDVISALNYMQILSAISYTWEQGNISSTSGVTTNSTTRIRTGYLPYTNAGVVIGVPEGYKVMVYLYGTASVNTFIGRYGSSWFTDTFIIHATNGQYFKIVCANSDDSELEAENGPEISVNTITYTDKTLSIAEKSADAKVTGDMFASTLKVASYDGENYLGNQTPNTICRVSNILTLEDAPSGIDLSTYYWMFTVGTINKVQFFFYPINGALYRRFYRATLQEWTTWEIVNKARTVKILSIGNSFNQDAMAYLPPILSEMIPDVEFTYGILYTGSADIADHVSWYQNNTKYNTFNYWRANYETAWSRRTGTSSVTLKQALEMEDWDIITIQGTSSDVISEASVNSMIADARSLLRIVQSNAIKPFSAVWFQWMGRPQGTASAADMFANIKNATNSAMEKLGICDYIPVGAAIQSARTNSILAALGDGGNMLYSDQIHMQAGIPALISAYTVAAKIAQMCGYSTNSVYASTWRPTAENVVAINASDGAGGGMTHGAPAGVNENNTMAAQEIVVQAVKYPDEITNTSDFIS